MKRLKSVPKQLINQSIGKVVIPSWVTKHPSLLTPNPGELIYGPSGISHQRRGASSAQIVYRGDIAVEFTIPKLHVATPLGAVGAGIINAFCVGFSSGNFAGFSENTIRWGVCHAWKNNSSGANGATAAQLDISTPTGLQVRESGVPKSSIAGVTVGDKVRIAAENGLINYYMNGARFYTSQTPVTYPLRVDVSLLDFEAQVSDLKIIIGGTLRVEGSVVHPFQSASPLVAPDGYKIRQILDYEAVRLGPSSSILAGSSIAGVYDIYLTNSIRVRDEKSLVLVNVTVNGISRIGRNIGGDFKIFSTGKFYADAVSAQAQGFISSSFGYPIIGPIIGDLGLSVPVTDVSNRASVGGISGSWLVKPFSSLLGFDFGGNHTPEGSSGHTCIYINDLRANFTVGMNLRKGADPTAAGYLECNQEKASKIQLIELVP